ncbi:MAG: hypothetical protein AAF351_12190 [Pseudomonadota bacterium]
MRTKHKKFRIGGAIFGCNRIANRLASVALLIIPAMGCAATGNSCDFEQPQQLRVLEDQMVERGHFWGRYFDPDNDVSVRQKFDNEFYDSANTFFRIGLYLEEEEPWFTYAKWANDVYREFYLDPNDWHTAAWRRSSYGIYLRRELVGDVPIRQLELMRDKPAFSKIIEGRGQGGAEHRSRAIALAVESHVLAERAGADRAAERGVLQLETFVPWMGSHLYEWRSGSYNGTYREGGPRFAPFMFGLTAHALIEFVEWERENGRDPEAYWPKLFPIDYGSGIDPDAKKIYWNSIETALGDLAIWMYVSASHQNGEPMWQTGRQDGFLYQDILDPRLAPDLNLMIAHVYAWLWKETGDKRFLEIGDEVFNAGALYGSTFSGKHFNQQFRYAFDFLQWRREGMELHCSTADE